MELVLLVIGKTKTKFVQAGIEEYLKRLRRYVPFKIQELPDLKQTRGLSEIQQKEKEGELILGQITDSDLVILLDENGKEYNSLDFAVYMERLMITGKKRVLFVIGGPYGFSTDVYQRADSLLSLSKMTFNHEMVRMFFTEQIYRAMTILRGEPYHHS